MSDWRPIETAPQDGTTVWIDVAPLMPNGNSIDPWAAPARWSTWDYCWRLIYSGDKVELPNLKRPRFWFPYTFPPALPK